MTPGLFDSHPGLTQGCTAAAFEVCIAVTPYGFSGGLLLLAGFATNYGSVYDWTLTDLASLSSIVGGGTVTAGNQTFAVWSVSPVVTVPEPSTVALLSTGLLALMRPLGRRARRIARAQQHLVNEPSRRAFPCHSQSSFPVWMASETTLTVSRCSNHVQIHRAGSED